MRLDSTEGGSIWAITLPLGLGRRELTLGHSLWYYWMVDSDPLFYEEWRERHESRQ